MERPTRRPRFGFTLIELLVVILIIGILIALLLPAINGAVQNARNATVSAEISQMATALEDFKSKFGEYPPSRIILREDGFYDVSSPLALSAVGWAGTTGPGTFDPGGNDLTYGQLAARSVRFLRKFFPRAAFTTSPTNTKLHDFTGTGGIGGSTFSAPILLDGHECLVFFLGGIPVPPATGSAGTTGFSKNPQAPFVSSAVSNNRISPMFEFVGGRLIDDDGDGMYAYVDPLSSLQTPRFYAYFYSYGGGNYDPNDVNLTSNTGAVTNDGNETVTSTNKVVSRGFALNNGVFVTSPVPNPYTTGLPAVTGSGVTTSFIKPESFQIISAGRDGLYGVGGQYDPNSTNNKLPVDAANIIADNPAAARQNEGDNISNFSSGRLD